ncbi:RNA 2'-phosphotransferase [Undibacterium squillarum]|uniref:Probable RNA 2'-phosphotransferase n=1 Tax=Undibacterium squillarum TaxID=1131567 RepID=A0ABQ2XPJ0_9BURK|nr:RNA 2'-phosphotransferase [Undibacterium squillarum]GGX27828.1 putative RNA 2'-phosphotransferase [Undibacterium squillarum]
MRKDLVRSSKFLSLVLRHKPEAAGIQLDAQGWCDIDDLLQGVAQHRAPLSKETLMEIVATNEKKRFAISDCGQRIRASQGHSIEVSLDLQAVTPPATLYHGTASRFLDSILQNGLQKQSRQHVHLSASLDTAISVGSRHGKPVVLMINCQAMLAAGHLFYCSENGVWLTDSVPAAYLTLME